MNRGDSKMKNALILNSKDTVGVLLESAKAGDTILIKGEKPVSIQAIDDIPYGHKIALTNIEKNESIYKYGYEIGESSSEIKQGEYVHVHNLDSLRGRGDLNKSFLSV